VSRGDDCPAEYQKPKIMNTAKGSAKGLFKNVARRGQMKLFGAFWWTVIQKMIERPRCGPGQQAAGFFSQLNKN